MDDNIRFISTSYIVDRKLYKYYSNIGYAIDCIKRHRIHLDNPHDFNNPFEAKRHFSQYTILDTNMSAESIFKEVYDYIKALPIGYQSNCHSHILKALDCSNYDITYQTTQHPINTAVQQIYDSFSNVDFSFEQFCDEINEGFSYVDGFLRLECKMSCFAEVCDSILMWSYYANSHKGVCIEFDLSKLDIDKPLNKDIINNLTRVHYSPVRSDLQHSVKNQHQYGFLVSKADVWSHEHEWRLICETKDEYLPFDCVSKVFLGVNFDREMKSYYELEKICRKHAISIEQCKLSRNRFEIEFETVYDGVYAQYLDLVSAYAGTPYAEI